MTISKILNTKHISQIDSKTGEFICPHCERFHTLNTDLLWLVEPYKPVFKCDITGGILTIPFSNLGIHPAMHNVIELSDRHIWGMLLLWGELQIMGRFTVWRMPMMNKMPSL